MSPVRSARGWGLGHYANKCPSDQSKAEGSCIDEVATHTLCQSHHTSSDQSLNHTQLITTTATLDQEIILLDSQSSVHTFNIKELLTDIRLYPEGEMLRVYSIRGHMDSQMVG
jgi:hypothetical protein